VLRPGAVPCRYFLAFRPVSVPINFMCTALSLLDSLLVIQAQFSGEKPLDLSRRVSAMPGSEG
jgi:hypothetical protein